MNTTLPHNCQKTSATLPWSLFRYISRAPQGSHIPAAIRPPDALLHRNSGRWLTDWIDRRFVILRSCSLTGPLWHFSFECEGVEVDERPLFEKIGHSPRVVFERDVDWTRYLSFAHAPNIASPILHLAGAGSLGAYGLALAKWAARPSCKYHEAPYPGAFPSGDSFIINTTIPARVGFLSRLQAIVDAARSRERERVVIVSGDRLCPLIHKALGRDHLAVRISPKFIHASLGRELPSVCIDDLVSSPAALGQFAGHLGIFSKHGKLYCPQSRGVLPVRVTDLESLLVHRLCLYKRYGRDGRPVRLARIRRNVGSYLLNHPDLVNAVPCLVQGGEA